MGMAGAELGGGEGTIINAGRIIFHFQPYQCSVRADGGYAGDGDD